jgi:hypothetical protein
MSYDSHSNGYGSKVRFQSSIAGVGDQIIVIYEHELIDEDYARYLFNVMLSSIQSVYIVDTLLVYCSI